MAKMRTRSGATVDAYYSKTLGAYVTIPEDDDDNLAPEHCGCPHCGERSTDWLICGKVDADSVTCERCHTTYWPLTAREA